MSAVIHNARSLIIADHDAKKAWITGTSRCPKSIMTVVFQQIGHIFRARLRSPLVKFYRKIFPRNKHEKKLRLQKSWRIYSKSLMPINFSEESRLPRVSYCYVIRTRLYRSGT